MNKKLIYICGKYTDSTKSLIKKNIEFARDYAVKVWDMGAVAICPHLNSAQFENFVENTTYEDFISGYLQVMLICDAIFVLPNYRTSDGSQLEIQVAKENKIPIFYDMDKLLHFIRTNHRKCCITNRIRKKYLYIDKYPVAPGVFNGVMKIINNRDKKREKMFISVPKNP